MKRHLETLIILIVYLGVFGLGVWASNERWLAWAVESGHAQYNIYTGETLYIPRPPTGTGPVFNMDQHK
jgi:hypothetical protein